MALQQTTDGWTLDLYRSDADKEYPEEDSDKALEIYAKEHGIGGIFFLNDSGDRCIWGPVVKYAHHTGFGGIRWIFTTDDAGRIFLMRKYQPSLSQIDRPKPLEARQLVAHPSEDGWNRPSGHKYHIASFPPEIRNVIFSMALTVISPAVIIPQVITCNWKRLWASTAYQIDWGQQSDEDIATNKPKASIQRGDSSGSFIELRLIERREIDASFLRSCSAFYKVGSGILYGNTFRFHTPFPRWERSPPSMMTRKHLIWRPNPQKPPMNDRRKDEKVQKVITQIRAQVHLLRFSGWAYYDPFLRFLHTIGPANAALLKKIELCGMVRLRPCIGDLVHCLHFYIPVIQAVCTGLDELILYAEEDPDVTQQFVLQQDSEQDSDEDEDTASNIGRLVTPTEAALRPILETELRQVQSLRKLKVFRSAESHDLYEWAIPAMHWFDDRNKQRKAAMEETQKVSCNSLPNTESTNTLCGFCGEAHPWNKCYNLCSLCGKYGHSQKSCPASPRKRKGNKMRD